MPPAEQWSPGQVIVRREVLNDGRAWLEAAAIVVEDTPELLASYIPEGSPFRFPAGDWPTRNGLHPWHGKERWHGHGVLMLQRPGESYAIWVFWFRPEREFRGWYVNLQERSDAPSSATTRRTSSSTSGCPQRAVGSSRTTTFWRDEYTKAASPGSRSQPRGRKPGGSRTSSTRDGAGGPTSG